MSSTIPNQVPAWTYTAGYPHSLKLSNTPLPQTAANGHILVQIEACALNPVDIQMMNMPKWKYPSFLGGDMREKGTVMDFSGTVISSGSMDKFKEGDEVFGMTFVPFAPAGGSLAQVAHFNLATTPCVKKPAIWSFEQAAAISLVWLTAKACIDKVAPWVEKSSGKRVAVLGGSSSTGIYSIILAKWRGWKVVATSSGANKDFVTNHLKADAHVDYTKQDVRKGVSDFQPDAVIDCVGGTECIGLPSSKRYVSIVGDKTGRTAMGGPYTYYDVWHPLNAATQWLRWAKGNLGLGEAYDVIILSPRSDYLEDAIKTLSSEDIHIDSVHAFEDAKKAFERLNTGRAKGKVVVKVQQATR
ncbi:2-methylene-furan-3-one reductase [Lecanosticta acicola]|uniref:2-methylene-furan-3-one reductase n=1 Tax=Lecanosticta acicola TaxID=111012 RepID=A0AAI8YSR1_9PEZI|nr:2-methylene-furan-3-one reductase [Lecanosticta acicola]